MTAKFASLVDSYLLTSIGSVENFLPLTLALALRQELIELSQSGKMKAASIGHGESKQQNELIRTDSIYWLDKSHVAPAEILFLDIMHEFLLYLNHTCYTGLTSSEFHFALYEAGSFYKKHRDQFHQHEQRQYTFICYLNEAWKIGDGGELCVHHQGSTQLIPPTMGRVVFFKSSELMHEVLLTHKPRLSITGWFRIE